jgi:hypothetical protein
MSITAMKQALEALEDIFGKNKVDVGAINSLRQAIEQAEKQEQGEPVGWIDNKGNMICTKINESCKPLYTTPQQRTWVWLTDEDEQQAKDDARRSFRRHYYSARGQIVMPQDNYEWHLIRAIEYKLKEKNT